jgi:2-dehydropantoate 2-reductase
LGTALAGVLRAGGAEVSLLGRGEVATGDAAAADVVLVCTKSRDTAAALDAVAALVGPETVVATLQNGLGNAEQIAERFGAERTAAGSTTHAARRERDGSFTHTARGGTALAAWSPEAADRTARVAERLAVAGLEVTLEQDPQRLLWSKLAVACGILPVTALLGIENGVLARPGPASELACRAAEEAAHVAAVSGRMHGFEAAARLQEVARRTASNRSSMLGDLALGRQTEVDEISGAVVRAAERAGVSAETNRTLWLLVRARERR